MVIGLVNEIGGIAPAAREVALKVIAVHAAPEGTTFAKVNRSADVGVPRPTLDDLPTIYDTDHH
jgi:hypothetical protein